MLSSEAAKLSRRYGEVRVPTVILAGEDDRIVSVWRHAERLHRAISGSVLHSIPGMGHMIHHVVPGRVLRAVDEIALRDARGVGPLAERTAGPPLRELLREVPHAPGEHGTTA
jgi:hypothetical protein